MLFDSAPRMTRTDTALSGRSVTGRGMPDICLGSGISNWARAGVARPKLRATIATNSNHGGHGSNHGGHGGRARRTRISFKKEPVTSVRLRELRGRGFFTITIFPRNSCRSAHPDRWRSRISRRSAETADPQGPPFVHHSVRRPGPEDPAPPDSAVLQGRARFAG